MKLLKCNQCGGTDLYHEGGYMVCRYCKARYAVEKEDLGIQESDISVNQDVINLLEKCKKDPKNAKKYANLILDIDPDNEEALKYL